MPKNPKIRIVLTLNEKEFFSLLQKPEADFLEIRLDQFSPEKGKSEKIASKIEELKSACVLTYRQPEDSSLSSLGIWTQEDVSPLLSRLEPGKHYVDLELDKDNSIFTNLNENGFGIIRSVHSFSGVPGFDELDFFLRSVLEEETGRETFDLPFKRVFKIAVLAKSENERKDFLESCKRIGEICKKQREPVGFCGILMGEEGAEFRIFPEKIGSDFTYSCLGSPKAPGQVDLQTLLKKRAEG